MDIYSYLLQRRQLNSRDAIKGQFNSISTVTAQFYVSSTAKLYSSNKVLCEMRASSCANFSFKNPSLKNNPSYRLSFQSVGIQTTFIKSHERKWQKSQLHCSGSPELVYSMMMLFAPMLCLLAP